MLTQAEKERLAEEQKRAALERAFYHDVSNIVAKTPALECDPVCHAFTKSRYVVSVVGPDRGGDQPRTDRIHANTL